MSFSALAVNQAKEYPVTDDRNDQTIVVVDNCDTEDLPQKIGKYTIIRMLGKGGMGTVYLGKDPMLDRLAAIKTLHTPPESMSIENRKQLVQRFLREAKSLAKINHNNIIKIYAIGRHESTLYMAMEYVEGQTLMEICKSPLELPFNTKLQYMIQMCEGLQVIHEAGLVHRDIKPSNIMVTNNGLVKIMDFGTVHTQDSELTRTKQIIGTPSYMSPEQVSGLSGTLQSDIFSLGSVFYLFLTGEKAFSGETFSSVTYKIIHSDPVPPSKINPVIPARLDPIILKCLEKSPELRHQDSTALLTALRELQLDAPARSQKVRRGSILQKTSFATALVLLLMIGAYTAYHYELIPYDRLPDISTQTPPAAKTPPPAPHAASGLSFQLNYLFQQDGTETIRRLRYNEELNPRDTYKICFTPDQSCYVYIYSVINELYVYQLFPPSGLAAGDMSNPVQKDRQYVLPTDNTPYVLGPKETVSIYFLAGTKRNSELERKYSLLKTAGVGGNTKFNKINRYTLRKLLRNSAADIKATSSEKQIVIHWNSPQKQFTFPEKRLSNLCDGCSTVIKFLNNRRSMDNWQR